MFTPQRFGKYFLFDRLAVGGMAEVFKAKLLGLEETSRVFALKRIHPHHMENKDFVSMLIDEAKISVQLDHGNIIQVVDIGRVGDQCFICMEYVEGKDMRQIFDRCRDSGQTFSAPDAVYAIAQVCRGLGYAHTRKDKTGSPLNIIHRDVSPQNVLISFDGAVKLIDFGIAKAAGRLMETQVGILKGKYAYMSPEQATGGAIDKRTDIFAAGVLLYEAVVQQHPFRAPHDLETLRNIKDGKFIPPAEANPNMPPSLAEVIETALENKPENRYQTSEEMANALDRVLGDLMTRYSPRRLSDFVQGLFADEVLVRGTSAADGAKLEKEFLTSENVGGAPRRPPPQETKLRDRPAPAAAGQDQTNIGPPPPAQPPSNGRGAGNGTPIGAIGGGESTTIGPPPGSRVPGVEPVNVSSMPTQTPGQGASASPGPAVRAVRTGPTFGNRIMTGSLTATDNVSLFMVSAVSVLVGVLLLAWTPPPRAGADPGTTPVGTLAMGTSTATATVAATQATPKPTPSATPKPTATAVAEFTPPDFDVFGSATATPAPTGPAMLMFRSTPKAKVYINGNSFGETPLNVRDVQPNKDYEIAFWAPGHKRWKGKVRPQPGQEVTVDEKLTQIPSGTLHLVTIPAGAQVLIDGVVYPEQTPAAIVIPAGARTISITHPSVKGRKSTFKMDVRAGTEYQETIDLRMR